MPVKTKWLDRSILTFEMKIPYRKHADQKKSRSRHSTVLFSIARHVVLGRLELAVARGPRGLGLGDRLLPTARRLVTLGISRHVEMNMHSVER